MNTVGIIVAFSLVAMTREAVDIKPIEALHERIIARQLGYLSATGKVERKVTVYTKSWDDVTRLEKPLVRFHTRYEIWQTPQSYRCNFFAIVPNPNNLGSGYEEVICQNCEKKDYLVKFTAHPVLAMLFQENINDRKKATFDAYDLRTVAIIARDFPNANTYHPSVLSENLRSTIGNFSQHTFIDAKYDKEGNLTEHTSIHKMTKLKQTVRFVYIDNDVYLSEVITSRQDKHIYNSK